LDPLSEISLKRFFKEVIENEKIVKIIHAPSEDIRIIQSMGYFPTSIFDSEKCAKLLNFPRTSLAAVLKEVLNVTLDKAEQKSNWLQRPLTESQLQYAALDVKYLSMLKKQMLHLAEYRGILDWLDEENQMWSKYRSEEKKSLVSKKDASRLSDFEAHCYNELLMLRDTYAKEVDKPGHFIIPKEVLIDMCLTRNLHSPVVLKSRRDVHRIVRKVAVERKFAEVLREARKVASELKLNTEFKGKSGNDLSDEEKRIVTKSEFMHLQENLCKIYGNITASYILPNRLVIDLATKRLNIENIEFKYKRKLFSENLKMLLNNGTV
jgi:ribonuclease D